MVQQQSNVPQPNFLGQQVGGYRLFELLGQGGFAQVYKGEHVANKHVRAIKVFIAPVNNQTKDRIMREAVIHSQLIHPHIIKMFGSGTQHGLPGFPQGVPFLALEWAPHGDLFHAYEKKLPLAPLVVVNLVNQIADGLQFAHDRNVLHRDLKPQNLLFNAYNQVLLADFGIARFLSQDDSYYVTQGAVKGTLSYMSPEHFQGKTNKTSDQYSLGVIAYEWLTGKRPFYASGDDMQMQMMKHHLFDPPPPLRQVLPSISPEIEEVVLQALEKASGDRFPSVTDLARALEAAAQPKVAPSVFSTPAQPQAVPATPIQPNAAPSAAQPKAASAPAQPDTGSSATQPDTARSSAPQPQASPLDSAQWVLNQPSSSIAASIAYPVFPSPPGPGVQTPLPPNTSGPGTSPFDPTSFNPNPSIGTAIAHFSLQAQTKDIYWLPNSPFLAATSVDNQIYVWDTFGSGKDIAYRHREGEWSPDYRYMAYPITGGVEVYDVVQQRPAYSYHGQTEVTATAWSPDGYSIASVGKAAGGQSIHIWYALTGRLQRSSRPHTGPRRKVSLLAWSPDGRSLACTDDSATVTIWSANDLIMSCTLSPDLAVIQEVPTELRWSATGRYLAIGLPGQVRVWDVWKTMDKTYQWTSQGLGQPGAALAPQIQNASKDVRDYLTYGQDQPLMLWCPSNANFQQNPNRRTENSFLALLNDSNSIVVWDVSTGGQVSRCTSDTSIHSLTWSPDGKALAAGGEQGLIEIWDPWTGKKLQQVRHGELQLDYEVHALAWSPTGHRLASGGGMLAGGDHHILLWQEQGLTRSVSVDLPSQSSLLKFIKRLNVSSWLALLLGLLDLAVPFLIGIITTSLLAFFVAPFFALAAVALAAKSVIDLRHTARSADDNLAFAGILALFSVVWGIAFFAVGDSASGGATGGFLLGAVGAAFVGWFLHQLFLKALYRGASYSDVNNPKTWGGEWGSSG